MFKKTLAAIFVVVLGLLGWDAFNLYRGGFFSMPDLPEGAYAFSFKNGMRGIVLDAEVAVPLDGHLEIYRRITSANPDRKYLSVGMDVPTWFKDAWSTCKVLSAEEVAQIKKDIPSLMTKDLATARLDAMCSVEADGKKILRGFLFSVPRL